MSNEPIKPINLTLVDEGTSVHQGDTHHQGQGNAGHGGYQGGQHQPASAFVAFSFPDPRLTIAYFAVAFGFLGIFTIGYLFVPLCLICSIIALVQGHLSWAFVGLMLGVAGFVTSPVLMSLLGFGTLSLWLLSIA